MKLRNYNLYTRLGVLSLLMLLCQEALAQFSVGAKFGYSGSYVYNATLDRRQEVNDGFTIGNTGGIIVQYITEKNFGLQMEVNYSQKGWVEDIDTVTNLFTTTLNYIDIPVMGHAYLGNKNVRYFINAGFFIDYLLSYNEKKEGSFSLDELTIRYNESRDNKLDAGIRGSIGVEILTKIGMFQLEGGYNFGIGSVIKKNLNPIPVSVQNQSTVITLGYLYMFNREKAEKKFRKNKEEE